MDVRKVVKSGLCLGCGACAFDDDIKGFNYSNRFGIYYPNFLKGKTYSEGSQVCPGKGYAIKKVGDELYGNERGGYSIELGNYVKLYAAHSLNQSVLENASSGGVMTELLKFLLQEKVVDKVVTSIFIYTQKGPFAKAQVTSDNYTLMAGQGSKYCPTSIADTVKEIKDNEYRVAYLGTPCQVAAIREMQRIDSEFARKIVITIANFCGGYKSYNNVKKLAQRHTVNYKNITYLRFRGGGQPGSLLMKDSNNRQYQAPYPNYSGYTGYSKLKRCLLCVDATGELADITCGDAWLQKYENSKRPWSIIIARNKFGEGLINNMIKRNLLNSESISSHEVCLSQKTNLASKKLRQQSRMKLYRLLGLNVPKFDGGYHINKSSMKLEVIVFFSHKLKLTFEVIGLYKIFRILLRKNY